MLIRRNSYYFENNTVGSVIPDLDHPTSYSYTIMPDHDTKFDDTIPTDALGGNQPGIIPDLKQEAMTSKMRSDFRSIIEMLGGPEPTDGLPAQMQMDFRALTESIVRDESKTLTAIKESVERFESSLSESQVQRLLEAFRNAGRSDGHLRKRIYTRHHQAEAQSHDEGYRRNGRRDTQHESGSKHQECLGDSQRRHNPAQ